MKFAFLIHPINEKSATLLEMVDGAIQSSWGVDPLGVCGHLHNALEQARRTSWNGKPPEPRIMDELSGLTSPLGHSVEGRLYEVPMDGAAMLQDPDRALAYMEQAVGMAVEWGARIVGLGAMTGIVGGRGVHLAERSPIAITTGNSLTVYSALQNVYHAVEEFEVDLKRETVAVVGIPGSIASAVAALLAPQCGELLLVGRSNSAPARKVAEQLGAELLLDIREALSRATIVVSATSTGSCINQAWLQPGTLVVDIGVPTDVQGSKPLRNDVLCLTGGLSKLPPTMPLTSKFLWFQHGMAPSCLGETLILALEGREESFSLGRHLDLDAILEIGDLARSHGFDFSDFHSFGHPADQSAIVNMHKVRSALGLKRRLEDHTSHQRAAKAATLYARHINPVLMAAGEPSGFVKTFVRGEDVYLYDAAGRRYLDFVGGFGSLNLGHNHPAVVEALQEALRQQAPGFAQSAVNPYATALAAELAYVSPAGLEMVFFANSGTEAVEAGLKLARIATGRAGLLHCDGSYHGKTMGSLSLAGNPDYRRPFGPLVPGAARIPYGDTVALERALDSREFAAFVVEPIQAEGGMRVPPAGYLRDAQDLCRRSGTLFIADEVQTGLGRTGTLFALEREGVRPDALALAKSLGGGLMPIGAMLTRRDLWLKAYGTVQTFALHSSTFGGGSLACAAGLAALRTLRDEGLVANAQARGEELQRGLADICSRFHCVQEVRGRGLLLGLEFTPLAQNIKSHWKAIDRSGMAPFLIPDLDRMIDNFHALHAMQTLLQAHGIYTQVTRSQPRVLRIEPPLTITAEHVAEFLAALARTCEEIDFSVHLIDGMIAKTGLLEHDATVRSKSAAVS